MPNRKHCRRVGVVEAKVHTFLMSGLDEASCLFLLQSISCSGVCSRYPNIRSSMDSTAAVRVLTNRKITSTVGNRSPVLQLITLLFEIFVLLGYYAASNGNLLPTFRDNVSFPSSRANKSLLLDFCFMIRNCNFLNVIFPFGVLPLVFMVFEDSSVKWRLRILLSGTLNYCEDMSLFL
jgi:hypothetical protein